MKTHIGRTDTAVPHLVDAAFMLPPGNPWRAVGHPVQGMDRWLGKGLIGD